MRTKFFCTNFLNTARGPGHPGKIPRTSRIPLFETQGRQSFEGGHEVFGHHPFAWKTPTPPGGLRTQKLNLCALFSWPEFWLFFGCFSCFSGCFSADPLGTLVGCFQCRAFGAPVGGRRDCKSSDSKSDSQGFDMKFAQSRSAKTDPIRFEWGFGEGLLKDEYAFFEACRSPIPQRRKLLAKHPFL